VDAGEPKPADPDISAARQHSPEAVERCLHAELLQRTRALVVGHIEDPCRVQKISFPAQTEKTATAGCHAFIRLANLAIA
jgi:hypothetical protein